MSNSSDDPKAPAAFGEGLNQFMKLQKADEEDKKKKSVKHMEPVFLGIVKKNPDGTPNFETWSPLSSECISFCAMVVGMDIDANGKKSLRIDMQTDVPATETVMHERMLAMHASLIKNLREQAGLDTRPKGQIIRTPPNWNPPKFNKGGKKNKRR